MARYDANDWSALGSVVNAVVVVALAAINTLYLRAANRQAKASEEQAKAAQESLRLALWGHSLEREKHLKRIVEVFASVQNQLNFIVDHARQHRRLVPNPLTPGCLEVQTVFLLLYPNLRKDMDTLILHLDKADKQIEKVRTRKDSQGDFEASLIVANNAIDVMRELQRNMKGGYPDSVALLSW